MGAYARDFVCAVWERYGFHRLRGGIYAVSVTSLSPTKRGQSRHGIATAAGWPSRNFFIVFRVNKSFRGKDTRSRGDHSATQTLRRRKVGPRHGPTRFVVTGAVSASRVHISPVTTKTKRFLHRPRSTTRLTHPSRGTRDPQVPSQVNCHGRADTSLIEER